MARGTSLVHWRAAIAAAALVSAFGPASAVDLPPAPILPAASPAGADEFAGWYLRGDVGAGFESAAGLEPAGNWTVPDAAAALAPPVADLFERASLSPSGTVDAGLGYAVNPWFRTDATLEYRFGARLQSTLAVADPGGPAVAYDRLSGGVASIAALLNGYAFLGSYWGVTPFVGAGLGFADNALSGVSDQGFALGAGSGAPIGGFFSNASKSSFAFAVMAGIDVDLAPNLKLELGYRYLNLGSLAVGAAHCFAAQAACAAGANSVVAATTRGTLASNEFRLGLVYLVGEPAAGR